MGYPVYQVPAGDVLPIMFSTYDGGTGASLTMSGLAVTDIEIYKDGSVTQRASDAGYTLLDTDGIDFDGITGIHGFSIDTGDNTDASFYTVGAWFHVVVSAVTVDAQTVSFIAAAFRIVPAESSAGVPKVDVSHWLGTAAATPTTAGVPEVDVTFWNGTAVTTPPAVNATQISGDSNAADALELAFDGTAGPVPSFGIIDRGTAQSATGTTLVLRAAAAFADDEIIGATIVITGGSTGVGQARTITDYVATTDTATVETWTTTPSGTITYEIYGTPAGSAGGGATAAEVWAYATRTLSALDEDSTTLDLDATIRAAVGLASANLDTQLAAIDDLLDSEIPALTTAVADLPTNAELATALGTADDAVLAAVATVDTVVDAIKVKTDQLTFTTTNMVDAAVKRVGDTTLTAAGTGGQGYGAA
jgi:hypothetical protein